MTDTQPVEPPAVDSRWGDTVDAAPGDWDREFWYSLARDVYGIDPDLLEDRPTEWIVGRVSEEPQRHCGGDDG